jgi:hypothetical protein
MPNARRSLSRRFGIAVAALLLLSSAADAEIYKCVGPDGKLIFTTEQGRCPRAQVHTPKGEIQSQSQSRPAAPRGHADLAGAPSERWEGSRKGLDDGMERMWRRKRGEAAAELSKVEGGLTEVESLVRGCRKGTNWLVEDESGLREHLPCSEIRQRSLDLEARKQKLTAYLSTGLEDECRRAGCLPGWIRP